MNKDLEKILIYHRQKHRNGDFNKSDWIHLLSDLKDLEKQSKLFGVGITLPTGKERILEINKQISKRVLVKNLSELKGFKLGFDICYRWMKDSVRKQR